MNQKWKYFLPGYLLALPCTLVGLIVALFARAHSFRWYRGALECVSDRIPGHPAAQTHGWLILYARESYRDLAWLRVHERAHVVQAFVLQVFALLMIVPWAIWADWAWYLDLPYLVVSLFPFSIIYAFCHFIGLARTDDWDQAWALNPFEAHANRVEHDPEGWGV